MLSEIQVEIWEKEQQYFLMYVIKNLLFVVLGITVATVIEFLLARESWGIILENYPFLETADIEACIEYTLGVMNRRYTIPLITA